MVAILLSGVVGAAALVVPNLGSIASGAESGPTFASSPGAGRTGTAIEASGTGCLLPATTTAGDGVIIDLHTHAGPVVASATIPVRTDGQWSGSLVVPADTSAADYVLAARCVYPGFDEFEEVWNTRAPLTWDLDDPVPAAQACVALLSDWFPATTGEIVHVDGGVHSQGA